MVLQLPLRKLKMDRFGFVAEKYAKDESRSQITASNISQYR